MGSSYNPPSSGSSTPELPVWTYAAGGGTPAAGKFTTDDASPSSTTHIKFSTTTKQGSNVIDTLFGFGIYVKIFLTSVTTGKVAGFEWLTVADLGGPADVTVELLGTTNETEWSGDYQISFAPNTATVATTGNTNSGNFAVFDATNVIKDTGLSSASFDASGAATAAQTAAQTYADGLAVNYATAAQGTSADSAFAAIIYTDTGWTANSDAGDKTAAIPSSATLDAMQAALNLVVAGFGDAFVASAEKTKALEAALVARVTPNA